MLEKVDEVNAFYAACLNEPLGRWQDNSESFKRKSNCRLARPLATYRFTTNTKTIWLIYVTNRIEGHPEGKNQRSRLTFAKRNF